MTDLLGKLGLPGVQVSLASLTAEIWLASCRPPDFHGTPADRMIVATAITLDLPLITADQESSGVIKRTV